MLYKPILREIAASGTCWGAAKFIKFVNFVNTSIIFVIIII